MMSKFYVESERVQYNEKKQTILSTYDYQSSHVEEHGERLRVKPVSTTLTFRTSARVPRVGVMLVGWGGNNGSTITASVLANKLGITWRTKDGVKVGPKSSIIMCTFIIIVVVSTTSFSPSSLPPFFALLVC